MTHTKQPPANPGRFSIAGSPGPHRLVSAAAYRSAPRYHSGFLPGELPAILRKGEAVLNERMTGRVSNVVSGLAQEIEPRAGFTYAPTIDNRGADVAAVARMERVLAEHEARIRMLFASDERQRTGMRRY